MSELRVAALYVEPHGVYAGRGDVDAWPKWRDATRYGGPWPVVAHPPCPQWSHLKAFARRDPDEKSLAVIAALQVIEWGGVLEHPARSSLFAMLPQPGGRSDLGFTVSVSQCWWGHLCRKDTWLFVSGLSSPKLLPEFPLKLGYQATCSHSKSGMPEVRKKDRIKTPPLFADWLIEAARRCARE